MKSSLVSFALILVATVMSSAWVNTAAAQSEEAADTPAVLQSGTPADAALVALGRRAFFDPRFSTDGQISCASCHMPDHAFSDGRTVSIGARGARGTRNAPSLVGAGAQRTLFWDGRRESLQAQVLDPLTNPVEHGLPNDAAVVAALQRDPPYLLDGGGVGLNGPQSSPLKTLQMALAAFVSTLKPSPSPFDRFVSGADPQALSAAAQRGFALFGDGAGCARCHEFNGERPLFTDHGFHSVGVGMKDIRRRLPALVLRVSAVPPSELSELISRDAELSQLGRFVVTRNPADIGKFKTPTLRNVALTAPYMHDGSVATLEEAIDHELYYRSLAENRPVFLSPGEKADLLEFLRALTEDRFSAGNDVTVPQSFPSARARSWTSSGTNSGTRK